MEQEAYVGSYSVLEANTKIQSRGHLNGNSVLLDGQSIPAGLFWARLGFWARRLVKRFVRRYEQAMLDRFSRLYFSLVEYC